MGIASLYDVAAPAKLNLFLHVVGRRADGYHLLQSVFVLIDWCDRLHFERRGDGRLARHDIGAALPADDLCLRAARSLQQQSGCSAGVDISIAKSLPSGAGMGGGSSDAATCLLALNRLWGLNWPRRRLMRLGLALGADVPFFVHGRNAFVEGVGERMTPIDVAPRTYAVVKPPASIDTRDIFASADLVRDAEPVTLAGFADGASPASEGAAVERADLRWRMRDPRFGRNDLQPVAERRCGQVGAAAAWLRARFGNARMTGSGSAVFASVEAGEAGDIGAAWPDGWDGRICRGLPEHPLVEWAGDGPE